MLNEKILDLLVMIVLEIAISTSVFWSYRRLESRVFSDRIWIVINHLGFVVAGYGILGYLGPSFPGQFSFVELVFLSSGIVLGCLLFGYWLDLLISRSNRRNVGTTRSREEYGMQRKP